MSSTSFCSNSSGVALLVSPAGGSFTGSPGVINGYFYPQLSGQGSFTITYTVSGNACGASAQQSVTVNAIPTVTVNPSGNLVLCSGNTLNLVASSAGSNLTYQWSEGTLNDTLTVNAAGGYSVTVTNQAGCSATSSVVNVNASQAPANLSILSAGNYCRSTTPQLLSGIPGGGYFTGNNVSGGYFTPADTGTQVITYIYTNNAGCSFSTTDTLVVYPRPEPVFASPGTVCLGNGPVDLAALATPAGGTFSGLAVSGNVFNPLQSGIGIFPVTYTYTDGNNCTGTANQTVQVQATPNVSVNLPFAGICTGTDSVLLSGGLPVGGVYSGVGVQNGYFFPQTAGAGTTNIAYTYTNAGGCSATDTTVLQVYDLQVNAGTDTAITCGAGVPLFASTNGTGTVNYSWSPATGLSAVNISNPVASPNGTTTYVVTASDGQCTATDTITVGVNAASFPLNFTSQQNLNNPPFNVVFTNSTPGAANYNFTWDFGDGTVQANNATAVPHLYLFNGSYTVRLFAQEISSGCRDTLVRDNWITCTNGCTHTSVINQVGPIQACQGDTVLLSASTNATGAVLYQWNLNGLPIAGAPNAIYFATTGGLYSVTVFSNSCAQPSAPVQVSFISRPPLPQITPVGNTQFCLGSGSVDLQATAGYQSYLWKRNNQYFGNGQVVSASLTGEYTVEATAGSGCSSRSAIYGLNTSYLQQATMCLVTVDTTLQNWNKNVISWEKPVTGAIAGFIIYRETSSLNVFDSIAYVPYSQYSEYVDAAAGVNPQTRSYRYRIAVVDTCGSWSLPGGTHRTMLLQINQGLNNTINLNWNHYQGITINSYQVMRGTNVYNMAPLALLPSNINSFTDVNPPDSAVYRINMVFPDGYSCTPSARMMAQRRRTASNISTNLIFQGEIPFDVGMRKIPQSLSGVKVSPNPGSGHFMVSFTAGMQEEVILEVTDLTGKVIRREGVLTHGGENLRELHLIGAQAGIYFLNLKNAGGNVVSKIVVQ
jgi:hypothetical protein